MAEIDIQQTFRKRLYYTAPRVRIVAVPNAGKRSQWAAAQANREGLAKGFPDLIALAPGGLVAFIEVKTAKGRASGSQVEWGEWLNSAGFPYALIRDADSGVEFLRRHGFPIMEQAA